MAPQLNHTIVHARDARASAEFLADLLGLPAPSHFGPFWQVDLANGVALDYADADDYTVTHYAFLVTEDEFDKGFARVQEHGLAFWADPTQNRPGEINRNDGGRGVYLQDPAGHYLELITRPYGSGG